MLYKSKSPYLLEHANDPVNWGEWSSQTLLEAKKENKLIFISIGYSTCHWCHVMQKESFKDDEVANILNKYFISIKIDKEERPDINNYYMSLCQKLNGHGGWPLTIILLPNLSPLLITTYMPKLSNFQSVGMLSYIKELSDEWVKSPNKLENDAYMLSERISADLSLNTKKSENINKKTLDTIYGYLSEMFDYDYGGFGNNMKFPMPHYLGFLLRYYDYSNDYDALNMVKQTLLYLRFSGTYDQIGFGVHRYSTARDWHLPHFEKMLYDQALIGMIYIETYQITKEQIFLNVAEEIASCMLNQFLSDYGAFYTAIDADSDGIEGKYYTITYDQLCSVLFGQELEIFSDAFGVERDGNYTKRNDMLPKGNILYQNMSHKELSERYNLKITEIVKILNDSIVKVRGMRNNNSTLKIDNKILSDLNGLAISFMSKLYAATLNKKYLSIARHNADFIIKNMYDKGNLFHAYVGEGYIDGFLDDYAFTINGFIDLYESSIDEKYLRYAINLSEIMVEKFYDKVENVFYFNKNFNEQNKKEKILSDIATPAGNSIAIYDLAKISRITGNIKYMQMANLGLESIIGAGNNLLNYTVLMNVLFYQFGKSYEFVIAAENDALNNDVYEVINCINKNFIPNKIILLKSKYTNDIADYIKNMPTNLNLSLYVCKNNMCGKPVIGIKAIKQYINDLK